MKASFSLNRRRFIAASALSAGAVLFGPRTVFSAKAGASANSTSSLPTGNSPVPVPLPHFPTRLHAFIWRNWQLVPIKRLAEVVRTKSAEITRLAKQLGLGEQPRISEDQQRRSYITVIRRNWHLLPYDQLLQLLGWTPERLADTLRYDDGLFWKLGSLKPACETLQFLPGNDSVQARANAIGRYMSQEFPGGAGKVSEPLFQFVTDLSAKPVKTKPFMHSRFSPRFCYSYFSLFGDPLLDGAVDPYPDGYLARLAEAGADGVWLNIVLSKLAPFPWNPGESENHEQRLKNLARLVARARHFGIGIYLYLNEPRVQPLEFFEQHPDLKGIPASNAWESGTATLCTSAPEVQAYLTASVAHICGAVPDLAGFFTITASEALTNCWSHGGGAKCSRCGKRSASEVIAEVNSLYQQGIRQAGSHSQLIAWDWGWVDGWAEDAINRLPAEAAFMSVSEWSIPIERGGVKSVIGEYSISAIGPGPRATRHWKLARRRGLKTIAKIQAGNTWELSATPYIPALENVARHAANLRAAKVDGLMLGWSLGGYPSPNLEVVAELGRSDELTPEGAMELVARRRFGDRIAPAVVQSWRDFSAAFSEFPFGGGIYNLPVQSGPSNLVWAEPTHYASGAVGLPYDDLAGWRGEYPTEILIAQLDKVATGFEHAVGGLKRAAADAEGHSPASHRNALSREISVGEAAFLHFRSAANQARFVQSRDNLRTAKDRSGALAQIALLDRVLAEEIVLAKRLHAIQSHDSRIGFEASNHYYYVPVDLAEKMINCRYLIDTWLPSLKAQWQKL
jgi:hypothetical protein